ncbi:TldD/PmbA family protein [Noviherbaspirillum sp. UKPF54]|uniref:TldD/PmbA family protein n=1 Tax=Noviherbaspirillum sp. UKPF54 TaxID=2601898 RepID=UPI0011B1320E|nr:TldD/PmbA family protein [Noviherbaspirillum sp. UKPF54]QDZ26868.1 TldD/PmbA family protein [Noviherbaspirillum sp. UKPF54]
MPDSIRRLFHRLAPAVDFCSLRLVEERSEHLAVRQDVLQPATTGIDRGAMITVMHGGGCGYAATSDLSESGLKEAIRRARDWARESAGRSLVDYAALALPRPAGSYAGPEGSGADGVSRKDLIALLMRESRSCRIDDRIVDWQVSLWTVDSSQLYLTADGADLAQQFRYAIPSMAVTASEGAETQTRSLGGQYNGFCRQGGLEVLEHAGFDGAGQRVAREALDLLAAPNCPGGRMDLLLMPEQMMLQIHESIGHPLELDRILGDERNFAGTSFVTLDMFGHYRYGSALLNVTCDPTRPEQFASYRWDDDGCAAERVFLIRDGVLERPLGGAVSQARAGLQGASTARACGWNRAPIDRMANLNIEPGASSLNDMIRSVERGVLMDTNVSWSIDDSRNKFQFGCEVGRLIEDGELKGLVKNPNYRGVSATFWRSLKAVGDASTFSVMGTPFCGKGEPSQVIRVGHASPACLFSDVDVFGGE